jgi:hypothetical protein
MPHAYGAGLRFADADDVLPGTVARLRDAERPDVVVLVSHYGFAQELFNRAGVKQRNGIAQCGWENITHQSPEGRHEQVSRTDSRSFDPAGMRHDDPLDSQLIPCRAQPANASRKTRFGRDNSPVQSSNTCSSTQIWTESPLCEPLQGAHLVGTLGASACQHQAIATH